MFNLRKSINGLKNVRWPARSQFLDSGKLIKLVHKKQRLIVLDGAHNTLGAKALKEVLKESSDNWLLIFGLVLSIVLMATAATLISGWIKKYTWIGWVGLFAILAVAIELIYTDLKLIL